MTSYLPGRGDTMVMKLRGVQEEETAHYHPHPVTQNVLSTTKKQKKQTSLYQQKTVFLTQEIN